MTKILTIHDLGLQPYQPIWALQHHLQKKRIAEEIPDTLLLLEHPAIYTIGRSGKEEDIIAGPEFLKEKKIQVLPVDRGGQVTYHGEGQMVGYAIFHLKYHKQSITWYIHSLEEVFIQVLSHWSLQAKRIEKLTGVWVGEEKIVALGVRMSRWVTMHGFAFNLSPDLSHYQGIIPCGIQDKGVTSLQKILGFTPPWKEVKNLLISTFEKIFGFDVVEEKEMKESQEFL